jgi:hypothetical protein
MLNTEDWLMRRWKLTNELPLFLFNLHVVCEIQSNQNEWQKAQSVCTVGFTAYLV